MERSLEIRYTQYTSYDEIDRADRELILAARDAAKHSHSPYSHFAVGAAARMADGAIECSANVESEVYPAGICAERNLLFNLASRCAPSTIESVAITSISSDEECYPCGLCRQTLLDTERRQESPIRIIMAGAGSATIVESASSLLPFGFKLQRK